MRKKHFFLFLFLGYFFSLFPFSLFTEGGIGVIEKKYNSQGEVEDLPYKKSIQYLKGGFSWDFWALFFVGGKIQFYQIQEAYSFPPQVNTSNFQIQKISPFLGISFLSVKASLGYQIDMGKENTNPPISDLHDAIFLEGEASIPIPILSIGGEIRYYLTLAKEGINPPDPYQIGIYIGWSFLMVELGSYLYYSGDSLNKSSLLSLAPYIKVDPPLLPLEIKAQLSYEGEYLTYGYPLSGKNIEKPTIGASLMLKLSF